MTQDKHKQKSTFSSRLAYKDRRGAVEWLEKAFGFKTTMLATGSDGSVAYAEMSFGNAQIQIASEWENVKAPNSVGGVNTQTICVLLENGIDAHCAHARAAGGTILQEPADQFHGDRTYRVVDPQGHAWTFSQRLREATVEEMEAAVPGMKIWTPDAGATASTGRDPRQILQASQVVLLVDWPSTKVPRALIEAGLTVFGYSPHHYSKVELVSDPSEAGDSKNVFPPENGGEKGYLVFRRLASRPPAANIVSVYRPAGELPGILAEHGLPLGAAVLWLQRLASAEERRLVEERGLTLVADCDIAETARALPRP